MLPISAHLEGQANGIKCIDSTANDSRYLSRCSIIMAVRGDIQKTMDVPFSRPSQRWVPYLPVVSDGNLGSQYLRAKWVPLQVKANHLYLKNQLITSLVKNKNSQGSESAVPAFTTSQSSTVRDGIVGRATVGAVGRRRGCVQWTSTMDDALLELYEQSEPSRRGYAARLLSLWKRRFPERNATESSLTTRVRRVRKLRSTPTATVVLKTTRG